jgi:hypothetical protein
MRRLLIVTLLLAAGISSHACAKTYDVPSVGFPTIQSGVDSAAAGDTVLVAPGSYNENIMMKDGVALLSSGGRDVTLIQPEDSDEPIMRCHDLGSSTLISGFTLQGGRSIVGAGMFCLRSSPRVLRNKFTGNQGDWGVGITCREGSSVLISENLFEDNTANEWGAGVYSLGSSPTIQYSEFRRNQAQFGGAVGARDESHPYITGNTFAENTSSWQGGAVYLNGTGSGVVQNSTFLSNTAAGSGGGVCLLYGTYTVQSNLFYDNSADYGGGVAIGEGCNLGCYLNTFYGNRADLRGSSVSCSDASQADFYNNIFANSLDVAAIGCLPTVTSALDCNDFWGNAADYLDCSPGATDFYEDPLFCDPAVLDFELQACSPCVDGYGCGWVGAYPVGCPCGGVATEPTTWGGIKAMYR